MADAQETTLWAIAIKGDRSETELKQAVVDLATLDVFKIPSKQLRVGTLDSLMSLSDDLVKMDTLAEAAVTKMYKQLCDLKNEEPTIMGVSAATYTLKSFDWDEHKFQLKTPLREMCEGISQRIAGLDDELKLKLTELNVLKSSLQGHDRKTQGNLMVKSLNEIVRQEDVMVSEYMTTVYVVSPKNGMKDFEAAYEKMATYVVPKSAKLLEEDTEYGIYSVVLFKKSLDEFKAAAREKRLTLREFTYVPGAKEADATKRQQDSVEIERLKGMLSNWCGVNYVEVYTMMLHLKAVRVFVEGVLRYGLTASYGHGSQGNSMVPNFKAFLLQPKKGKTEMLRKALSALYGGSASAMMESEEETVVPGATGEFYPYVYAPIETTPSVGA